LATAFLHLLPEAFESEAGAHALFMTLLIGLVFFFLLDKAELWHHGHEHGHDHNHHAHGHHGHVHGEEQASGHGREAHGHLQAHHAEEKVRGQWAALAVLAHEVPHHMGDLAVLRQGSSSRQAAIVKVSMAGAITALGGAVGYVLVDALHDWLPYFLVVASSSFVYVALADLIPQLQKRLSARETASQILWLGVGMGMVVLVSALAGHQH
jgi:zinc and cadmium transporter